MHHHSNDTTPLESPAALAALWHAWGDVDAIAAASKCATTWGELYSLGPDGIARYIGHRVATVPLAPFCPPPVNLPEHVRLVTRADHGIYPPTLDGGRWPALYVAGRVPQGRAVLVVGSANPSPGGVEAVRACVLACSAEQVPIVSVLVPGLSADPVRVAVAAGGCVTVIIPHALNWYSEHMGLLDDVRRSGGAVVTVERPHGRVDGQERGRANRLGVALSSAVFIGDVGAPPSASAALVRAAVDQGKYLIVRGVGEPVVPAAAAGTAALARHEHFTPEWFGASPAMQERLGKSLPAADVIVNTQQEISVAVQRRFADNPFELRASHRS